ncbi:hypothetical protein BYT27DRAFT_7184490 [Phlegmacium glaucopus]|nr:hypothetical protein BYT27DRAFT_7184490 [Phlegmacium glaucopus]
MQSILFHCNNLIFDITIILIYAYPDPIFHHYLIVDSMSVWITAPSFIEVSMASVLLSGASSNMRSCLQLMFRFRLFFAIQQSINREGKLGDFFVERLLDKNSPNFAPGGSLRSSKKKSNCTIFHF